MSTETVDTLPFYMVDIDAEDWRGEPVSVTAYSEEEYLFLLDDFIRMGYTIISTETVF